MSALWLLLIPVVIVVFAVLVGKWLKMCRERDSEPVCDHAWWPTRWTQDGWTRVCSICGEWDYLGDDFDNRPVSAERYHKD